jgi:hypothetical protein
VSENPKVDQCEGCGVPVSLWDGPFCDLCREQMAAEGDDGDERWQED